MELRNLLTFIQVAELGSFTKAAEALGYSQSTVSFQIKQLEEELGCSLFDRINHTVNLTERGMELISYAHQVRALTDEFKEGLDKEREISGRVHIVAPDSVCEEMINSRYIDFHNKFPSVSIKFTTGDSAVMLNMLDHNEADIIITLDSRIFNTDYVVASEMRLPIHFVANASSPFAGRKGLSIRDIINEPFILTEHGQGYRRVFERELAKNGLEISPVLEIGRTDIITSIIAESNMISFLPDFISSPLVEAGKLCYLDVTDIKIDVWKQLIYHKNKWLSKSLKTFIDYMKKTEFSE